MLKNGRSPVGLAPITPALSSPPISVVPAAVPSETQRVAWPLVSDALKNNRPLATVRPEGSNPLAKTPLIPALARPPTSDVPATVPSVTHRPLPKAFAESWPENQTRPSNTVRDDGCKPVELA